MPCSRSNVSELEQHRRSAFALPRAGFSVDETRGAWLPADLMVRNEARISSTLKGGC